MIWPFKKKGYTEVVTDALEAAASGAYVKRELTGYIVAGASTWMEAFSLADVKAGRRVQAALSPTVLGQIGWDCAIHGAALHRIRVAGGRLALERPLSVYRLAQGGGWQLQVGEPARPVLINVMDAAVLFVPWNSRRATPFTPVPPWKHATGDLGTEMDAALVAELAGPVGSVLFLNSDQAGAVAKRKLSKAAKPALDFSGAKRGRLAVLQNWTAPHKARALSMDSVGKPYRIGAAPPQALSLIRDQLGAEILASLSIPSPMIIPSPGPAIIAARRNFERCIIPARFKLVSDCLSMAFNEPVEIVYPVKYRADVSTAARTVSALVGANVPTDEAMEIAHLR